MKNRIHVYKHNALSSRSANLILAISLLAGTRGKKRKKNIFKIWALKTKTEEIG